MIKIVDPVICPPIACVTTFFQSRSKYPELLLYIKKGSLDDPSNYCPISLLSVVGKMYEKMLFQKMTKFIGKHKLISQNHFAFRRNLSCVSALNEITEFVCDTKNKSMNGMTCFIDQKSLRYS